MSWQRAVATEEHLFTCETCTARLQSIVGLGVATRELVQQGRIAATLTPAGVAKFRAAGLRLREYHLDPGGSVNCTIAPDDDLVVSHLHAPLADVSKLDLEIEDVDAGWRVRIEDIGFDSASNEVTVIPKAQEVRKLHTATQCMRLFAIHNGVEHLLGEYVFRHTRHPEMK